MRTRNLAVLKHTPHVHTLHILAARVAQQSFNFNARFGHGLSRKRQSFDQFRSIPRSAREENVFKYLPDSRARKRKRATVNVLRVKISDRDSFVRSSSRRAYGSSIESEIKRTEIVSLLQRLAEQSSLQLQRHYVERCRGRGMHRRCSCQESAESQRRQPGSTGQ